MDGLKREFSDIHNIDISIAQYCNTCKIILKGHWIRVKPKNQTMSMSQFTLTMGERKMRLIKLNKSIEANSWNWWDFVILNWHKTSRYVKLTQR